MAEETDRFIAVLRVKSTQYRVSGNGNVIDNFTGGFVHATEGPTRRERKAAARAWIAATVPPPPPPLGFSWEQRLTGTIHSVKISITLKL